MGDNSETVGGRDKGISVYSETGLETHVARCYTVSPKRAGPEQPAFTESQLCGSRINPHKHSMM